LHFLVSMFLGWFNILGGDENYKKGGNGVLRSWPRLCLVEALSFKVKLEWHGVMQNIMNQLICYRWCLVGWIDRIMDELIPWC
jgi:hypothetical protein